MTLEFTKKTQTNLSNLLEFFNLQSSKLIEILHFTDNSRLLAPN